MRALLVVALSACGAAQRTPSRVLVSGALGYDVAISEDGRRAAAVVLDTEFSLVWLALPEGRVTARVRLGDPAYDCADVAVSGTRAAVVCRDGRVRVFEGTTLRLEARLDGAATAVALTPDYLVTGSSTGVLCLRRVGDGALLQCVSEHLGEISSLFVDGDVLTSGAHDGTIASWDLPSLRVRARWRVTGAVTAVTSRVVAVAERPPHLPDRGVGYLVWLDKPDQRTPTDAAPVALGFARGRLVVATWAPSLTVDGQRVGHFPHVLRGLAVAPDGTSLLVAGFSKDGRFTLTQFSGL